MIKKYLHSFRLYGYSILPLMIKKEYKVLGAWTVKQKSLLR